MSLPSPIPLLSVRDRRSRFFFFYLMYFFFFSIVGDCSYQKVYVSNQRRRETPKNLKVNDFLEMITVNTAQHWSCVPFSSSTLAYPYGDRIILARQSVSYKRTVRVSFTVASLYGSRQKLRSSSLSQNHYNNHHQHHHHNDNNNHYYNHRVRRDLVARPFDV